MAALFFVISTLQFSFFRLPKVKKMHYPIAYINKR